MSVERLVQLGFTVAETGGEPELSAELLVPLVNPLSRQFIEKVSFRLREGRLAPASPPELVGLGPLPLTGVERFSDFEAQLHGAWDDAIMKMQRRSRELQALGLQPQVEPRTLELTSTVVVHGLRLGIAADKQGDFRVVEATRDGEPLPLPANVRFELSEFREGQALGAYLGALVADLSAPGTAPVAPRAAPQGVRAFTLGNLAEHFGAGALVPQTTPVEIVVDLVVGKERYRFAASRLVGRTFRGLLAGPRGKVWADRFELDEFPGVVTLAAAELGVPQEQVELLKLADR